MGNPELGAEHIATLDKKNSEAIDNEGWLHSGDKVRLLTRTVAPRLSP